MKRKIIIGICGKIGTGKTTIAKYIQAIPSFKCNILPFAQALKEQAAIKYDFPYEWTTNIKGKQKKIGKESSLTVGECLQYYGQLKRKDNPNYWCGIHSERAAELFEAGTEMLIVDDVRHENEVEELRKWKDHGYTVVICRIHRHANWEEAPGRDHNHKSETELDNYNNFDLHSTPPFGIEKLRITAHSIYLSVMQTAGYKWERNLDNDNSEEHH